MCICVSCEVATGRSLLSFSVNKAFSSTYYVPECFFCLSGTFWTTVTMDSSTKYLRELEFVFVSVCSRWLYPTQQTHLDSSFHVRFICDNILRTSNMDSGRKWKPSPLAKLAHVLWYTRLWGTIFYVLLILSVCEQLICCCDKCLSFAIWG